MTPERKYALTRLAPGDYLCASNDGKTLWRFERYEDGAVYGLVVDFDRRPYWRASSTPMPPGGQVHRDDVDELPWVERATMLSSRAKAAEAMLTAAPEPKAEPPAH